MTRLEESLARLELAVDESRIGSDDLEYVKVEIERLQIGNVDRSRLPVPTRTLIERVETAEADNAAWERAAKAYASDVERLRLERNRLRAEVARFRELNRGLTNDFNNMLVSYSKEKNRADQLAETLASSESTS